MASITANQWSQFPWHHFSCPGGFTVFLQPTGFVLKRRVQKAAWWWRSDWLNGWRPIQEVNSSIYTLQPDTQILTCARLSARSLASPSALVSSLLSRHGVCLQQPALLSLSFTLSPQQQRPMSTGVKTVTLSQPSHPHYSETPSKNIPSHRVWSCWDSAGRRGCYTAGSCSHFQWKVTISTKSCSVCKAVGEQIVASDAIKARTVLMSKKRGEEKLLLKPLKLEICTWF